jgi:hypothetical protein
MEREQSLQDIAVLRHSIHINNRLRLETIASLSRLFREYQVPIKDELLGELILALPAELNGTNYETLGHVSDHPGYKFEAPPIPPQPHGPVDPPEPPEPPQPPEPPDSPHP